MNKKISNLSFTFVLFFMTNQMFSTTGLNHIMQISKQNVIYVPILSYLIGLIPFAIFIKYYNYKDEMNFYEKMNYTYKKLGKIFNFIIFLFISLYFTYSISTLNIYIQSKYLTDTPSFIITLLFLIPIIYLVNTDIYSICKVTFVLFIIYIIEYLFSAIGLIKFVEIENLMPFIDKGFFNILKSSLFYTCYFTFPMFLLLLVPKSLIKNPKTINRDLFIGYSFSHLIVLIILIFLVGVFGIDLALIFDFPIFSLLTKINFFDFITHVENILSFIAVLTFFINTTLSLYAIKKFIKNDKIYYIFLIICFILSLILFNNHTTTINFIRSFFLIVFIPTLLLLIKKRNKN